MSRLFISILISFCIAANAGAQTATLDDLYSPWGVSGSRGVDPFGHTLLSASDRQRLEENLIRQDILSGVAERADTSLFAAPTGYLVQGAGYVVTGASGAIGGVVAAGGIPVSGGLSIPVGVGIITGGTVAGGWIADLGGAILDSANTTASARIAVFLHEKYGDIIRPNGVLNEGRLREIGDTTLFRAINSEEFRKQVPDLAILADLKNTAVIDMLSVSLRDSKELKLGVEKLDRKLVALDQGYSQVKNLQERSFRALQAHGQALGNIESGVDATSNLVTELIASKMPAGKVVELAKSGALTLKASVLAKLQVKADADAIRKEFDDAASVFNSSAMVMKAVGVDDELVNATVSMGSILSAGGAFAAAVTLGEPLSIFNTGAALFGNIGGLFGKKKSDPTGKALQRIMQELRALSEQIQKNHFEQMEALRRINLKLEDLSDTLNRRFAELGLDVSYILMDTRELLYEDVRVCERLADEFRLPETQSLLRQSGLLGFTVWFEADYRAHDFARCLNGLTSRQRVVSEREFSGMLRADSVEESEVGASADQRRSAVRRIEQRVLQPTVDYIRKVASEQSATVVAANLFQPFASLCDVYHRFPEVSASRCAAPVSEDWTSRITQSFYNPGQGALLSTPTAILMARFSRMISPWNGVLIERSTGGIARVMSRDEVTKFPKQGASRRTRHLLVLNNSVDSLDLSIAQANVVAGVPVMAAAAKVLDEVIVPAYAKARRLSEPADLNKLLATGYPEKRLPGPDCTRGTLAWNTLCIMETNPVLGKNVIRAFIALRLKRKGATFEQWRAALRAPFSVKVQELIGPDVLITDAATGVPESDFGIWAFELPKVFFDPDIEIPADGTIAETDCWTRGQLPLLADQQGKFDENALFYTRNTSSRCHLIDGYLTDDFLKLNFSTNYRSLVTERTLAAGLRDKLCSLNKYYPTTYCRTSDSRGRVETATVQESRAARQSSE